MTDLIEMLIRSIRTGPHYRTHRIRVEYADRDPAYVNAKLPAVRRGFTLASAIYATVEQAVVDRQIPRGWVRWRIEHLIEPVPTNLLGAAKFEGVDRDAYPTPLRKAGS